MEFASRYKCIEHYQSQFPNLPRYMIEMALDYDLQNGGASNEKPKTGKEKRKEKASKKQSRDLSVRDAIESGDVVELDTARVITDYQLPPLMPGYICADGVTEHARQEAAEAPASKAITEGFETVTEDDW